MVSNKSANPPKSRQYLSTVKVVLLNFIFLSIKNEEKNKNRYAIGVINTGALTELSSTKEQKLANNTDNSNLVNKNDESS
jgi:hypothetical protein